jgi:hypothetical protein
MSTDLNALDRRISIEFMGYIENGQGYYKNLIHDNDSVAVHELINGFSPTTNMCHAYVVLEKIASMCEFGIYNYPTGEYSISANIRPDPFHGRIKVVASNLPLTISKFAEQIMNSEDHMKLFRESIE